MPCQWNRKNTILLGNCRYKLKQPLNIWCQNDEEEDRKLIFNFERNIKIIRIPLFLVRILIKRTSQPLLCFFYRPDFWREQQHEKERRSRKNHKAKYFCGLPCCRLWIIIKINSLLTVSNHGNAKGISNQQEVGIPGNPILPTIHPAKGLCTSSGHAAGEQKKRPRN